MIFKEQGAQKDSKMLVNNHNVEKHPQGEKNSAIEQREDHAGMVYEVDVLNQFKANMAQLEDLQSRLKFVLGEVSDLMKKR